MMSVALQPVAWALLIGAVLLYATIIVTCVLRSRAK